MEKNYIIYGSSRSGKSTLARMMCAKFNLSYVSTDKLVTAFEKGLPELGISHAKKTLENASNFERFFIPYLKTISHLSRFSDYPIYHVVEGAYINLDSYMAHLSKKFKIIILVQDIDANAMFINIRKHDTNLDWTFSLTDEELLAYCNHLVESNKYIVSICQKLNLPYYYTHQNRQEVFDKILGQISRGEL